MNRNVINIWVKQRGQESYKNYKFLYFSEKTSNQSPGLLATLKKDFCFSFFDNILTVRNKIYFATKIDPRSQVIFFKKDQDHVFVPQFREKQQLYDNTIKIFFDPRPLWGLSQGLSQGLNQGSSQGSSQGPNTNTITGLKSINIIEDKARTNRFNNEALERVDNEFSNLGGLENNDGSIDVYVLNIQDLIKDPQQLENDVDDIDKLTKIYQTLLLPFTFTTMEQFKSFSQGVVYGGEQGELYDDKDLPGILKQEYKFLSDVLDISQSFSAQLGYITFHQKTKEHNPLDLRDLFNKIDVNKAVGINHVVLFMNVEGKVYHLTKTRRGIQHEAITDNYIHYEKTALNIVINAKYILYIFADGSVMSRKFINDTKEVVTISGLLSKIKTHKQLYALELQPISNILEQDGHSLNLKDPYIELRDCSFIYYSSFKATSRKETDVMTSFSYMDIVGQGTVNTFQIHRITNDWLSTDFTRLQGRFTCRVSYLPEIYISTILKLFQCIFTYSEIIREGKGAREQILNNSIMILDPSLFQNIKSYNDTYPRTCALQRQPKVITQQQYEADSQDPKKKHMVGVLVTTTGHEHYLTCEHHSQDPYFYQITGKQADDRCFPCCKKKIPNLKAKVKIKSCKQTGYYLDQVENTHGKYVIRNFNQIKPDRLARLPNKLGYLLKKDAYILGVEQELAGHRVGLINTCMVIAGLSIFDFLRKSEDYYMKRKGTTPLENRQFIISIIEFFNSANASKVVNHNNNVDVFTKDLIYIMPYTFGMDLLIVSLTNEITTLSLSLQNKGIIFRDGDNYYPIIKTDPVKFNQSKDIDADEFALQAQDKPRFFTVSQIKLNKQNYSKAVSHDTMYRLMTIDNSYKIVRLFVNADDNCYGMLVSKDKSNVFIPFEVEPLEYLREQYITAEFYKGPFDPESVVIDNEQVISVSLFLSKYYSAISVSGSSSSSGSASGASASGASGDNINSDNSNRGVEKILFKNNKVIGFVQQGLLFYCQPIHLSKLPLPRDSSTQMVNINYSMTQLNQLLYEMRLKEKEGTQFQTINDPQQLHKLHEGLLLQSQYFALKLNVIDTFRKLNITPRDMIGLDLKGIEDLIRKHVTFVIKPLDVSNYDNIIVPCSEKQEQSYCQGKKVVMNSEEDLNRYLQVLVFELYRAPVATFVGTTSSSIIDQLEFTTSNGQVTFTELQQ